MSYTPPSSAKSFTLSIPDEEISDFKQLLKLSKLGPDTWEGRQKDRRFGITHKWLTEAKDYWLNKYDWQSQEKRINSFPNYTMEIEGLNTHFIALFSEKKDAIPIIFMHGWPGSFIEFIPMLDLIKKKYSSKDLPYHIVVASLNGYPLSEGGPLDKDWDKDDTARIMNTLMTNLGFNKYIAQGGDVGSFVATSLGAQYDACVAVHLNMIVGAPPEDLSTLTESEMKHLQKAAFWRDNGTGYAREHGTRPSTIGHVLSSSPLALLAWIGEKLLEWSDTDPSLDDILTNVSLYWFTQAFPRSIYPYRENFSGGQRKAPEYIPKPLGVSAFPCEIFPALKQVAEKAGQLVWYKTHDAGGHFAALEKPKELLEDVEEFVKVAWKERSEAADANAKL